MLLKDIPSKLICQIPDGFVHFASILIQMKEKEDDGLDFLLIFIIV